MCRNCKVITVHPCVCGKRICASGYCMGGHRVIFAGEEEARHLYSSDKIVNYPRPDDVLGPVRETEV